MILFIYGQDSYRSRQKLFQLREKYVKEVDPSGNSLVFVDGQAASFESISQAVRSSSLLSKKTMVIIENLFANKKQTIFNELADYLKKLAGDNIIIFWDELGGTEKLPVYKQELFKFLCQQKFSGAFKLFSSTEVAAWIKAAVAERGGQINTQAAGVLASLLGTDLRQISNEIDKLIHYKAAQQLKLNKQETALIEVNDITEHIRGKFDEKIFALTDAISHRRIEVAGLLLYEQIEGGLTDSYLLSMITRQFKILMQVRQAIDEGLTSHKIASSLRLHPFVVQKSISQARNFSVTTLKSILRHLIEMDYLMKSGRGEIKTMLHLMMAKL